MKVVVTRLTLLSISVFVISLMLTNISFAKIDLKTCVGAWLFDEGSGTTAKDSAGNKNNGTLVKGPQWVEGKFGKALKFAGTGDHVLIEDVRIPPNGWSISSWVSRSAPLGGIWISHNESRATNNNLHLFFRDGNGGRPEIDFYSNALVASSVVPEEVWTHIAFVVEPNGNRKVYINAKLDKTDANTADYTGDTAPLHIGEFFDCCKYKGLVDEVAIFDVALTADDITSIMTKGLGVALSITAVSPSGKLTTTWSKIKAP